MEQHQNTTPDANLKKPYGWVIETDQGERLEPTDSSQVVDWLKKGKISLDDLCCRRPHTLTKIPLRHTLGRQDPKIEILFDPVKAKRRQYGKKGFWIVFIPATLLVFLAGAILIYQTVEHVRLLTFFFYAAGGLLLSMLPGAIIALIFGWIPGSVIGYLKGRSIKPVLKEWTPN